MKTQGITKGTSKVFEFKFKTKRSDERGNRGWGIACYDNVINIKKKIDYCSVVEVEEQRGICRGIEPKTSLIPGDCAITVSFDLKDPFGTNNVLVRWWRH